MRRYLPGEIEVLALMKVQDFAYHVAVRTIELLEETQHYKIPEPLRKEVTDKILAEVDDILKRSK